MKIRHTITRFFVLSFVFILTILFYLQVSASSKILPANPDANTRFAGPFESTSLGIGGTVIIDMTYSSTTVSGYINFTNDPDVGSLCGAGSFSGTRSGDHFEFSFVSDDSDPGCEVVHGTTFNVEGTLSSGVITNGQYTNPATSQGGTFSASQTTRYDGTFSTNGYNGMIAIDLVKNSSSMVTGYMNFTNNPGAGTLCGAGSFRGSIDGVGKMNYDFISNDPDSGCSSDDGLVFDVSATLQGNNITNGTYTVSTGQSGTFSASAPNPPTHTPTKTVTSTPTSSSTATTTVSPTTSPTITPPTPENVYLPLSMRNFIQYFEGTEEVEPNNDSQHANGPIYLGETYYGYQNDEKDYFSFLLKNPAELTITLNNTSAVGVQLILYYETPGNTVGHAWKSEPYQILYSAQPGLYYVHIYSTGGWNTTTLYELLVTSETH